jgi:succinyl-CoA synthetase beta subunit
MNIHEYQAKELLAKYGALLAKGGLAYTPEEAYKIAQSLGGNIWAVKAQIHAGGRGKSGGVKIAKSLEEVKTYAQQILGMQLITHQTSPQGQQVRKIYIEEGCDIANEFYFSLLIDRKLRRITAMVSSEGGIDIEEVAKSRPEAIVRVTIDPIMGFLPFHAGKLAFALRLSNKALKSAEQFFIAAYKTFTELDASLIEVNPLVLTTSNEIIPLDAKITFDSNGLFRHPQLLKLRDEDEEDPSELIAKNHELSYIKLDGNIGCMVNGAGLAMATMDVIKIYGGDPANFLDVGGSATRERVTIAFKLILSDPHVKAILVNIFGGIMRCDIIAEGIIAAAKETDIKIPLIVRLAGTNVEKGKELLIHSQLPIISADDLGEAALKAVKAIQGAS